MDSNQAVPTSISSIMSVAVNVFTFTSVEDMSTKHAQLVLKAVSHYLTFIFLYRSIMMDLKPWEDGCIS